MKSLLSASAALLAATVLLSVAAPARAATPRTLVLGETTPGEITTPGGSIAYTFDAGAGDSVVVNQVATSNYWGLYAVLADSYGRVLASGGSDWRDLGPVAVMGGTYTLTVYAEADQTGTYELIVTAAGERTVPVSFGETIDDAITTPGESVHFPFSAPAGATLFVDQVASSNYWALNYRLTDARGRDLVPWTYDLGDRGPFPLEGGDYVLSVRSEGDQVGTFQLALRTPEDPPVVAIAVGEQVTGTIEVPTARLRYTFTAAPGERLAIDYISSTNYWDLGWLLEDARGRAIVALTGDVGDRGPLVLEGGDYTLSVVPEGDHVGSVTFRLVDVVDEEHAIAVGETVAGALVTPYQQNTYLFSLAADDRVTLDSIAVERVWDFDWRLVDALGRVIVSTTDLRDYGPVPLAAGDYRLTIVAEAAWTGTYEFRIVPVVDGGGAITLGDSVSGDLAVPGQKDVWTFTAGPGQVVTLHQTAASRVWETDWLLQDALGRAVVRTTDFRDVEAVPLVGGTYTLTVLTEQLLTATYAFTLVDVGTTAFVPAGVPIALDTDVAGEIAVAGEVDTYALTLAADTTVFFDLTAGAAGLRWTLTDPVGRTVFGPLDARDAFWHDQGPFPLAAGTWTLAVEHPTGGTGAYGFGARAVVDQTGAFALEDVVEGTFAAPGERHVLTLTLAADADVYFDLQQGQANLTWALADAQGAPVFGPADARDAFWHDQGPFPLAAGTYTMTLDANQDVVPSYRFQSRGVVDGSGTFAVGDVVSGGLTLPGTRFRYTVDVATAGTYDLDLQAGASQTFWTLTDPFGQDVFTNADARDPRWHDRAVTLGAGTYSLTFDATADALPAWRFQLVPTATTTRAIALDELVAGTFAGPGDEHVYELTLTAPTRVYFDVPTPAGDAYWSAETATGEALFTHNGLNNTDLGDAGPFTLGPGTVRITVIAEGGALPSYEFRVARVVDVTGVAVIDGDPVVSAIDTPGATGTWTVEVEEGRQTWFDLLGGAQRLGWSLVDPVGVPVFTAAANDTVSGDIGPPRLAGGTYRVVFDADYGYLGAFSFRVVGDAIDDRVFYYTRYAGAPNVKEATYNYRDGELVLKGVRSLASTAGADGILIAPDGDILVGGQGDRVHKVDAETGSILTVNAGGTGSYHLALDPSGTIAWSSGIPGALAEIGLFPFTDGIMRPISGDATTLTSLAFDRQGDAFYTRSGPGGNGSFGLFDMDTFTATQVYPTLPAAHGMAFDVFTGHLMLFGATAITQLDPETLEIVSERVVPGMTHDQGTVDGAGHAFIASNTGHLVFVDYAATGLIGHEDNVVATPFLDYNLDDVAPLSWLGGPCFGQVIPIALRPASGSTFPPGTTVTISGTTRPFDPTRPVAAVVVDGAPAASRDAAGTFFHPVTLAAGENEIAVEVVDRCGTSTTVVRLFGEETAADGFATLEDVTTKLDAEYRDTTFDGYGGRLLVDVRVRNDGDAAVDGPVLMVLGPQLHPAVRLENPAGETPEGEPYVVLVPAGATLEPGATGDWAPLSFADGAREPVRYDVRWMARRNQPPEFATAPPTTATIDAAWTYAPQAFDPEGEAVSWALTAAPAGLTMDLATGRLDWTPVAADVGLHDLAIEARDDRGGRTSQRWRLTVREAPANRPPIFTSAPVTHVPVGGAYVYAASAADVDGDIVTFALDEGPDGMLVDPASGRVSWDFALPGAHLVSLTALDGAGGVAQQTWTLAAGDLPANPGAPVITSVPVTEAAVALLWVYQPVVSEPDGDPLTFSLSEGPETMAIDPGTGRVTWMPDEAEVGAWTVTLTVQDGRGGAAHQTFLLTVSADAPNLAPLFQTTPALVAVVDVPYAYPALATDPDLDPVTYTLRAAPAGALVDPDTGLVTWTPQAGDEGTETLALSAADDRGAVSHQVFVLTVRTSNDPPRIASTPATTAFVGETYRYDVAAVDPDGDRVTYELVANPVGARNDAGSGLVTWTPSAVGDAAFTVAAVDAVGARTEQSWTVTVTVDTTAPTVMVWATREPGCLDAPVTVCVGASDDVGIRAKTLTVDGAQLALDAAGCAPLARASSMTVALAATATDPSGNVGQGALALPFVDCNDAEAPTVTVDSPAPGAVVTGPVEIVATIADNQPAGLTWTVAVARVGTDDFTVIAEGTGAVAADVIATFDPTLLPNDSYRVQIVASDGVQTGGVEFRYGVGGEYKLGNIRISFTDLLIPVAGIPLAVTRHYDSLDTTSGDFGAGWRLGLSGAVSDDALETPDDDLTGLLSGEAFTRTSRVYVTKPDGTRVGFTFAPRQQGFPTGLWVTPAFDPDEGVEDTLEAVGGPTGVLDAGGRFYNFIIPYNPATYALTTREGLTYTIDEVAGLQRVEDALGNTLDVTPEGVTSSMGVALAFERDDAGRITRIIEPDADPDDGVPPGALAYDYDARGNLVAFRDLLENETLYRYDDARAPHYLTAIEDPLGRPVLRYVFDDDGRVVGACDAAGDPATLAGCETWDYDVPSGLATRADANGNRSDLFYDERGNIVVEREWLDDVVFLDTLRVYDEGGHLVAETDPDGNTRTWTFDERGNALTYTDPGGRTWTYSYEGKCTPPAVACDPLGNCARSTFDANCNALTEEDALGGLTEYRYADSGALTEMVDPVGNVWRYTYGGGRLPRQPRGPTRRGRHVRLRRPRQGAVRRRPGGAARRLHPRCRAPRGDNRLGQRPAAGDARDLR